MLGSHVFFTPGLSLHRSDPSGSFGLCPDPEFGCRPLSFGRNPLVLKDDYRALPRTPSVSGLRLRLGSVYRYVRVRTGTGHRCASVFMCEGSGSPWSVWCRQVRVCRCVSVKVGCTCVCVRVYMCVVRVGVYRRADEHLRAELYLRDEG